MKSILSLCVIFVLVACYSGSPVAKKSKSVIQGIQNFAVESHSRSKRLVKLLPALANTAIHFSEDVSKGRNKRSNNVALRALAQLQGKGIASKRIAEIFSSDLVTRLAEEK